MKRNQNYLLIVRWLPVIVWCLIIYFLSSLSTLPGGKQVWWDFVLKKSAHMFEYFILYILVVRAFDKKTPKVFLFAFIFCISYALSDEFHQSFTPGRTPKLMDVGFDSIGSTIAYLKLNEYI
jgi:VanZ family protein